jgi:hypothetical protein
VLVVHLAHIILTKFTVPTKFTVTGNRGLAHAYLCASNREFVPRAYYPSPTSRLSALLVWVGMPRIHRFHTNDRGITLAADKFTASNPR